MAPLHTLTRRHVLAGLAGAAAGLALPVRGAGPQSRRARDSIGVALVGLGGYAGGRLAPGLQLTRHCHLAGIVTGTPSKIPEWQQRYGIADRHVYDYDGFDRIADDPAIDVVYIATPNDLHMPLALRAAAAGKHVWVEKPMAMDAAEAQRMIDACARNKVQLAVGYRLQHEPNTQRLMAMARERPFGAIRRVTADAGFDAFDDVGAERPWRMVARHGGGAMYDMGVYALQGARYTTGLEPVAVSAQRWTRRPQLFDEVDEGMRFTLEFPDGSTAACSTSFGANLNTLRADCADGWYELSPFQTYDGIRGRASDGRVFDAVVEHQQALQMDNDALAILRGTPPRVPGEEGLRDMRVVDAVFASERDGGRRIAL
ncbi:Gfo/Idh/MocA family oxidoreductase [Xanthomonas sp. XNM01]|uniref:Gfo/Idh/MocA family protein n=1 Tax=Xanthomonas sp. XNM01 TaxID=2769289 RepID=UPI00177D31FA|nr:Gfo/Idh/MocA family oxidoreductase [Xanthomonas sp. XNM01]MBD9367369.1 Gfo/Idh/MocA family oxidoreductase [Xanthomonas sp. XNM01]